MSYSDWPELECGHCSVWPISWAATEGNPEREVEMGRVSDEIERALQNLPVEQREAFLMKHVEGWSYHEMSETLDVSVPALKMRVHRAREELQVLLQSYGS